jgi:hypothetical protein
MSGTGTETSGTRRPKAAVVAASFGGDADERGMVTRTVAAALAWHADVEVFLLADRDALPRRDGAFVLTEVAATRPDPLRLELLRTALAEAGSALRACDLPPGIARHLPPAGGGRLPRVLPVALAAELARLEGGAAPGLPDRLAGGGYDLVLVAGLDHAAGRQLAEGRPRSVRLALLPLAGGDPGLELAFRDALLRAADVVVCTSPFERELLEQRAKLAGAAPGDLADVGLQLDVNELAARTRPLDVDEEGFLLVLVDWPPGTLAPDGRALLGHLRARLPTVPMVVLEHDATTVGPALRRRRARPVRRRTDLWRLVARASATVDLRRPLPLAREVVESLRFGTPVIVRAGTVGEGHAAASGGGLWFAGPAELVEAVAMATEPGLRGRLAAAGRRYADAAYGDTTAFVERVGRALLGDRTSR